MPKTMLCARDTKKRNDKPIFCFQHRPMKFNVSICLSLDGGLFCSTQQKKRRFFFSFYKSEKKAQKQQKHKHERKKKRLAILFKYQCLPAVPISMVYIQRAKQRAHIYVYKSASLCTPKKSAYVY